MALPPFPGKPAVTGDPIADIKTDIQSQALPHLASGGSTGQKLNLNELWEQLQKVSITDLQYASAIATASKTAGGDMRAKLWNAWITLIQAQQGVNAVGPDGKPLGEKPSPSLFTTFEQLAEVVDSLQPTSPFMIAATPVANAFKMDVLQLVTMAVSGVTSLGALGVAIP